MSNNKSMIKLIHFCGRALTEYHYYSEAVKIWQAGITYKDKESYLNLAKIYVTDLCTQHIADIQHPIKVTPGICRGLIIDMWQNFPKDTVPFLKLLITLQNIPQEHRDFYKKLLNKKGENKYDIK